MRSVLTRTTPATNSRLTTLATFKGELGETSTDNDALYGRIIDICSNEIAAYLNTESDEVGDVTLGRETLTQTFYEASGHKEMVLSRFPIGEVTSIAENGVVVPRLVDDQPNPAFNYVVKKSNGVIWKMVGNCPTWFQGSVIAVIYTAGWILPGDSGRNLPLAIEDACLRFCRVKLDQIQEGDDFAGPLNAATVEGVGKFEFKGGSTDTGRGLPYEVRNLIERYKTPNFA